MAIQLRFSIILGLFTAGWIFGGVSGTVVAEDVYESLAGVESTPPAVVVIDDPPPAPVQGVQEDIFWMLAPAEPSAKAVASPPRDTAGHVAKTSSWSKAKPETSPTKVVWMESPSQKAVASASVASARVEPPSSNDIFDQLANQTITQPVDNPPIATTKPNMGEYAPARLAAPLRGAQRIAEYDAGLLHEDDIFTALARQPEPPVDAAPSLATVTPTATELGRTTVVAAPVERIAPLKELPPREEQIAKPLAPAIKYASQPWDSAGPIARLETPPASAKQAARPFKPAVKVAHRSSGLGSVNKVAMAGRHESLISSPVPHPVTGHQVFGLDGGVRYDVPITDGVDDPYLGQLTVDVRATLPKSGSKSKTPSRKLASSKDFPEPTAGSPVDYDQATPVLTGFARFDTDHPYYWLAPSFFHRPLYFEQPNVERYGHYVHGDLAQSAISGAHFFGSLAILPYQLGTVHHQSCDYTLGRYRPGSCNPRRITYRPFNLKGAVYQGLTVGGAIWLIP